MRIIFFQNNEFKSLNKFWISHSFKQIARVLAHVQKSQYNNHLLMSYWSKLMSWLSVKLSSSSQLYKHYFIFWAVTCKMIHSIIKISQTCMNISHFDVFSLFMTLNESSKENFLFIIHVTHCYTNTCTVNTHVHILFLCTTVLTFPSKRWPTVKWESKKLSVIHNSIQVDKTDILV